MAIHAKDYVYYVAKINDNDFSFVRYYSWAVEQRIYCGL